MPRITNIIERFIKEMLEETENGIIEIGRNELAEQFGCAPSQINYVLTTRFTPYKGYYIESRRGGGGYIKIMKVGIEEDQDIGNLIINVIGDSITKNKAYHLIEGLREENIISKREEMLMKAAIEDTALASVTTRRNDLRADILKNMLLILIR
ncbi:Transcriptional regulator CtsR [[Clostridium] ultunense Esp]|uniref:Transcriptional regulator CtsR n=1 Tax=[Clostridium] ultunense Esp TaxID=1288971 RepID=M1ZM30_9FIRM|nr:CtsR family transcriptional regulator [Schnuerera ultunensis]CCQ98237.1 Transcriptional regulator CtsR [[Clostridium] ultunense Esp]SHD78630.1 transcriptional regulator [[Clostridium] ultunense Esp]